MIRACVAGVLVATLAACATGAQSGRDLSALAVAGDEAEHFDSLEAMAASSDAVIVGTASPLTVHRTLQGDAEEDVVVYLATTVSIEESVSGAFEPGDAVTVEFLSPATTLGGAESLAREVTMGDRPNLMMLRDKGGDEAGIYRIVNSLGLWVDGEDGPIAPLSEHFLRGDGPMPPLAREVTSHSSIEDVAAAIKGR